MFDVCVGAGGSQRARRAGDGLHQHHHRVTEEGQLLHLRHLHALRPGQHVQEVQRARTLLQRVPDQRTDRLQTLPRPVSTQSHQNTVTDIRSQRDHDA